MKTFILAFSIILLGFACVTAQTNSLIVKLKNGKTETIDLSKLAKIQFSEINAVDDSVKPVSINMNYPNPFNDYTTIEFDALNSGYIEINIFDNFGRVVFSNPHYLCASGRNQFRWEGVDNNGFKIRSGVYYLEIGNKNAKQRKMIVFVN